MDLTRDVTYPSLYSSGPISLNNAVPGYAGTPTSGRTIDRVEWIGTPGVGYTEKRAQAGGNDASDIFDGPLHIRITGTQYGETIGHVADGIRELRSTFSPELAYASNSPLRGYLPLTFYELTAPGSGVFADDVLPLLLFCRPLAGPAFTMDRSLAGGSGDRGGATPWQITLEAKDPTRYLSAAVTYTASTGTSATDIGLTNRGDKPAPLLITLAVPSPGVAGTLRLVGPNSSDITIATEVAGTRTYSLDAREKLLWVTQAGKTTLRMDLLTVAGAEWPTVPVNTLSSTADWTVTGLTSGSFTLTLAFFEAFA